MVLEADPLPYGQKIKALSLAFNQTANASFAELELTCAQGMILGYLNHSIQQTVYPKDIEQHFNLSHPTVSGLLRRLEAKGFIACVTDPQDRRCKRITLTEKAMESRRRGKIRFNAMDAQLVSDFTPEEKQQFWTLLCRAAENVKAQEASCAKEETL